MRTYAPGYQSGRGGARAPKASSLFAPRSRPLLPAERPQADELPVPRMPAFDFSSIPVHSPAIQRKAEAGAPDDDTKSVQTRRDEGSLADEGSFEMRFLDQTTALVPVSGPLPAASIEAPGPGPETPSPQTVPPGGGGGEAPQPMGGSAIGGRVDEVGRPVRLEAPHDTAGPRGRVGAVDTLDVVGRATRVMAGRSPINGQARRSTHD